MKNNLENYFLETDFDFQEPNSGHFERFENKLKDSKKSDKISWKWLSLAASVLLLIGFWFGKTHQKNSIDLADISPKMEEVQGYFVSTIHQKIKQLEKNKNPENEKFIKETLQQLESLEVEYQQLLKELNKQGNQEKIINFIIINYQLRLEILENMLKKINQIKNLKNEIYV
jgi:DNA-directed RNA polymerase beta' subunit